MMDSDNNIIDLYKFHHSFKHIKSEHRFIAELNAASLTVDWSAVTVHDCRAVLQSLAKADGTQGQGFYALALALMSALVYQTGPVVDGHKYARKIMRSEAVGDDMRNDFLNGWSVGEILMDRDLKLNQDQPDKSRFKWQSYQPKPLETVSKSIIDETTAVYLLDQEDGIFAYRDMDGYLVLNIPVKSTEDILIDEEMINGNVPMYYTASTHFQSPVWKMRTMAKAILEVVRHLEFPDIPIRYQMLLPQKTQMLINEDDIWDREWKGLPLQIIRGKNEWERCEGAVYWPMQDVWARLLVAAGNNYRRLKQSPECPF